MAKQQSEIVAAAQKIAKLQELRVRVVERLVDLDASIADAKAALNNLVKDAA